MGDREAVDQERALVMNLEASELRVRSSVSDTLNSHSHSHLPSETTRDKTRQSEETRCPSLARCVDGLQTANSASQFSQSVRIRSAQLQRSVNQTAFVSGERN